MRHQRGRGRANGQRCPGARGRARSHYRRSHADCIRRCRPVARGTSCGQARNRPHRGADPRRRRIGDRIPARTGGLRGRAESLHATEALRLHQREPGARRPQRRRPGRRFRRGAGADVARAAQRPHALRRSGARDRRTAARTRVDGGGHGNPSIGIRRRVPQGIRPNHSPRRHRDPELAGHGEHRGGATGSRRPGRTAGSGRSDHDQSRS